MEGGDCMHGLRREGYPFDLYRGDYVQLHDGDVGVTIGIVYGAVWAVRLTDGSEVRADRETLTWTGKSDGLPNRMRR